MFGFLRPPPGLRLYRQTYARLCQYHRMHYGLRSLPFLSYEGALVYLFAVESDWFPPPEESAPLCCRLRRDATLAARPEAPLGHFCAALGMLLGAIKLDDDVRDGRWGVARAARWMLRRPTTAAANYFRALDPLFDARVEGFIAEHLQLERPTGRPCLEDYAAPTAEAFAYVFGLLARVTPRPVDSEILRELGQCVGAAIIAFDCAVDWPRDQRTGNFNPLRDDNQRRDAYDFSRRQLTNAAQLCRRVHGGESISGELLDAIAHRVQRRTRAEPLLACGREKTARTGLSWRSAGYLFSDFGMLAFADCACEGCGACCEAGGSAADGGCSAGNCCRSADAGSCCCEFCCFGCPDSCGNDATGEPNQRKTKSESEPITAGVQSSPDDAPNL